MEEEFEIRITGSRGFFTITGSSERAKAWMELYVDGDEDGVAHCDDIRMVTEIADAALEEGIAVGVNGRTYIGDGHAAA